MLFRDNVRKFINTEITPHEEQWDAQQHVDRDLWRKAGAAGLLCTDVPEAFGGAGGTFAHESVILEEQAYACNTRDSLINPRCCDKIRILETAGESKP